MTAIAARVVVAGLGDVGAAVARRLREDGVEVTGIRRGAAAPAGVHLVRADLSSGAGLQALGDRVDVAVCCLTPDAMDEASYRQTYLDGTSRLAAAVAARGCRRLLFVSSTAVYGQDDGGWVDESSATDPGSFRGRVMLEAEAAGTAAGVATTALRCAGIYGPGRSMLLRRVLEGRGVPMQPVSYGNRIHRDDVVGALHHLVLRALADTPLQAHYIAVDDAPAPHHEVLSWLARRVGVELVTEEALQRGGNKRLRNARLKASGYQLCYPDYRSGYGPIIAALQASGELQRWRDELR